MIRRVNAATVASCVIIGALGMVIGCSQPNDIITPVSSTTLELLPERLPTTPEGMVYEFWAARAGDTVSLGRFRYNYQTGTFTEANGSTVRSNRFVLGDDLLRTHVVNRRTVFVYQSLLVTVERNDVSDAPGPGPIMLVDNVTNPDDNPIEMVFPMSDSLWTTTARMNMQGSSSKTFDTVYPGTGIWFSTYAQIPYQRRDTAGLTIDSTTLPRIIIPAADSLTYFPCGFDPNLIVCETTIVTFGPDSLFYSADTLQQWGMKFVVDTCQGKTFPIISGQRRRPNFRFVYSRFRVRNFSLGYFSQDEYGLPDLRPFGWLYEGWVVSNQVPPSAVGAFTPPANRYKGANYNFIPGDEGGLLSTGQFWDITDRDLDGNRFGLPQGTSLYPNFPLYPGGDFLNTDSLSQLLGLASVQLVPGDGSGRGTAFISLEPMNRLSDTTNFPLMLYFREVPTSRAEITNGTAGVQLNLLNGSSTVTGSLMGFPEIDVSIVKE